LAEAAELDEDDDIGEGERSRAARIPGERIEE
jgi:hypothetical protein